MQLSRSRLVKATLILMVIFSFVLSCSTSDSNEDRKPGIGEVRAIEGEELVSRGKYLVVGVGCGDCHSPKKFTAEGTIEDSTKLLAGHPQNEAIKDFDISALKPGNFMQMSAGFTSFIGPWGISYAANLTPDSATGIGAWTGDNFIKAIRTGKHLGQDNGRPILPPMPWFNIKNFTDEDLKAIYSYLRTIPPVINRVPPPVSPADAAPLAKK